MEGNTCLCFVLKSILNQEIKESLSMQRDRGKPLMCQMCGWNICGWRCSAQDFSAEESREVVPEGAASGGLLSVVNPSFSLGRTWFESIGQPGVVLRINLLDS